MRHMFEDARKNLVTVAVPAVLLVGGFVMARTETFVGDRLFLESMIPHHSRALLVCEESTLTDPEIVDLCGSIVESQTREIEQMEQILERYSAALQRRRIAAGPGASPAASPRPLVSPRR